MKNLDQVREFFKNDRFATENGAVIDEIGELYAKCSLEVQDKHRNAVGAVMGGVSFMLADFAFAVAANHETVGAVSINASIAFVETVKGSRLIAVARCIKNGRTACYFDVDVTDDLGTVIARVSITGLRKNP